MTEIAACQCTKCLKYLTHNREFDGPQLCGTCDPVNGIPLAKVRGTLTDPLSLECLGLISEECAETIQRKEKIVRWGWEAYFEGTTQQHKLESELGDLLAMIAVGAYNEQITVEGVRKAYSAKIQKLVDDAEGPRQRVLHAEIPNDAWFVTEFLGSLAQASYEAGGYPYLDARVTLVMDVKQLLTHEQFMPRVDGVGFRCDCGCNVFKKVVNQPHVYVCNACETRYIGE